jgi:hypothetical protein
MKINDDTQNKINGFLSRDNAKFISIEGKNLKCSMIEFICECGEPHKKGYNTLRKYDNSAKCKDCTKKIMLEKTQKTNNKKYGVDHVNQTKEARENNSIKHKGKIVSQKTKDILSNIQKNLNEEKKQKISQKRKQTYLEKTGYDNPTKNPETIIKRNKTNMKKYGTIHPAQNPIIKEKGIKTKKKIFSLHKEKIIKKKKETMITKYGADHSSKIPNLVQKKKETMLKKYGVEHYSQHPEFKEKSKKTCRQKYGTDNAMQNGNIAEKAIKNSYKRKIYITPNGDELICQGYETFALNELFREQQIKENDLINYTSKVPIIGYIGTNGKKRKHFVDIYLPKENKCIEVKSTYLFSKDKENILNKQKAGKELGYEYEIWIYDTKKINKQKYKLEEFNSDEEIKGKMHKIIIY